VTDLVVAVLRREPVGPRLDGGPVDLDSRAAGAAHEVVVVRRDAAAPVERLAVVAQQGVDVVVGGHRGERAVDRAESDRVTAADELGVDLLRAAELLEVVEHREHRGALTRGAARRLGAGHAKEAT